MSMITKLGAVAGAFMAIVALVAWFDIATGGDIKRLDSRQVETAVDIYTRQLRGYILTPPPTDPAARAYWNEEIATLRENLKAVQERKIELGK